MLEIYCLSILFNALLGYFLAFTGPEEKPPFHFDNEKTRLGAGVLSFVTGILKLLSPVYGNVPVAGDLFPALAGMAGGFILVFEVYRSHSAGSPLKERIGILIEKNRKLCGCVCLGAAALHLVFYSVLFL